MSNIIPFYFKSQVVRVLDEDNEPWFVAKDVCDILDLNNITEALRSLDDDEKADFSLTEVRSDGYGQSRNMIIVSESGFFSLVLKSRKPEAKEFRRWITREVLPSIRKTGSYTHPACQPNLTATMATLVGLLQNSSDKVSITIQIGNAAPPVETPVPALPAGSRAREFQAVLFEPEDPVEARYARLEVKVMRYMREHGGFCSRANYSKFMQRFPRAEREAVLQRLGVISCISESKTFPATYLILPDYVESFRKFQKTLGIS